MVQFGACRWGLVLLATGEQAKDALRGELLARALTFMACESCVCSRLEGLLVLVHMCGWYVLSPRACKEIER